MKPVTETRHPIPPTRRWSPARTSALRPSARRPASAPRGGANGALPNLIVIGGLKCGTTSLHHYLNLHPEIGMSRPKELNFFVEELNWELGADWYRGHFPADVAVRGETSPHYTNRPRFEGVAERMRRCSARTSA